MSTRVIAPTWYYIVLAVLILLTILTVGVSFANLSGYWHISIGITIGICKAALVGLFFMHLIDSRHATWAVVIVAIFWLIVVLMGLTYSDYVTRSLFPFTPGH